MFWAERRVPSGIAAVMMATIPVFMTLSEILIMKTQQLTVRLAAALLVGIAGVGVLVSRSASFGDAPIDTFGACALIVAAISWSVASALTRKLPLPSDKGMSSGAQMFVGGVLLTITAFFIGRVPRIPPASCLQQSLVGLGLPGRGRIHHCLYGVRLADSP